MQFIIHNHTQYLPILKDGKLDVIPSVAYGSMGFKGMFMLTVYVRCKTKGAGTRGAKEIPEFDIPASRVHVPGTTTPEVQVARLTLMMNLLATQMDTDYRQLFEITPKKPVSEATRRRHERERQARERQRGGYKTMDELFTEHEKELLWHTKT